MGLQQISADSVQRLIPKPSVRSESRSDRPSETFESYLDKARSAREPEGETDDEPVEPADEPREANEDADASQDVVAESSTPIVVETPTPLNNEGEGPLAATAADADTVPVPLPEPPTPATRLTDADAKPTIQTGSQQLATQADSAGTAGDSATTPTNATVDSALASSKTSDAAQQSVEPLIAEATKTEPQQTAQRSSAAPAVRESSAAPKPEASQQDETTVDRPRDAQREATAANRQTAGHDKDAQQQQAQQQSAQRRTNRLQQADNTAQPTVHEQKIKASIQERRQGDGDQPQVKAEQTSSQAKESGAVKARMDVLAQSLGAREESLPTAVKVLSGDRAAEGLGRFLLSVSQGVEGDGANATHGASSPVGGSTNGATSTTSTAGAQAPAFADTLAASLDAPESLDAATRLFRADGANGRYHVTMQLDPPELGQIRLQVHMQDQGLTLQVDAESSSVAKLIESRLSQLRESLAAHGIRIERADVVVRPPSGGETNTQHQQQNAGQHNWTSGTGDQYGDLPGDGRQAAGSQDEQRRSADLFGDVYEDSDGTTRVDGEDAGRGWMNRTAATELSLDLVA